MKNQLDNRFPKVTTVCLALLLIVIAVLAGYGGSQATAAAAVPEVMTTASSNELVWVRQEPAVINVNNDETYWESTEPRFAGSYTDYGITETEIILATRYVDHGWEGYNVEMNTVFDRPPIVLNPPLRYQIKATASHSGSHEEGSGSVGYQFWYSSPKAAVIEPKEVLGYYPFDAWWDGKSSKEWMINPPAILFEGETFQITASWWNCAPCNVTWTYKAEPANAVERLGGEVVQPVVTYAGEEILPGEMYYPETCPGSTRLSADACANKQVMKKKAKVNLKCTTDAAERLLLVIELLEIKTSWSDEEVNLDQLIVLLAFVELADDCKFVKQAGEAYQLGLTLEEGAMQLSNPASVTTSIKTPLGTATTASRGAFMTGYAPNINVAIFQAYSTPLLLEPKSGSPMVLKKNQEVTLTSKGFGPVTELPHVFLPMVINPR